MTRRELLVSTLSIPVLASAQETQHYMRAYPPVEGSGLISLPEADGTFSIGLRYPAPKGSDLALVTVIYLVKGTDVGVPGVLGDGMVSLFEERTAPIAGTAGYGQTNPFYRFKWAQVHSVQVKFLSVLSAVEFVH